MQREATGEEPTPATRPSARGSNDADAPARRSSDAEAAARAAMEPLSPKPEPVPYLTADEAIKTFKLPPGFRAEVVAAEPMVQQPVAMTFDPDGRLWVVEMRAYMPDVHGKGEDRPLGRVSVLQDADGDGRMDKSTVFLDGLVMPRAIAIVRDGVLIAAPPKLMFCRDTDGDGDSDEQTVVATDYGSGNNPEHEANGLMHGLDNWIYNANYDKRFRNEAGRWITDVVPGPGQWGITQDDFGRQFHNSNSDYLRARVIPPPYATRNPNYRAAGVNVNMSEDQTVWPAHDTAVNRGYRPNFLRDDKLRAFTGACGPVIYRGDLLPAEVRGSAFVCEPVANLIRRAVVAESADGSLSVSNAHGREEFLTSTYERFRPVNLSNGPDGALYVVDMHHGIIQHVRFLTPYARAQYLARQLERYTQTGRIYRIVPDTASPTSRPAAAPKLAKATSAQLVAALGSGSGWLRDTAQRLLVEKNPSAAASPLKKLVADSKSDPRSRIHALWALEGMRRIDLPTIKLALKDPDANVRAQAIRLAEPTLGARQRDELLPAVLALADDAHPRVRLQFALTVSAVGAEPSDDAIVRLLAANPGNVHLVDAALTGLRARELIVLQRLLRDDAIARDAHRHRRLVGALAESIIREGVPQRVTALIQLTEEESNVATAPRPATATQPAAASRPATSTATGIASNATGPGVSAHATATTGAATARSAGPGAWRREAVVEALAGVVQRQYRRRPLVLEAEPGPLLALAADARSPLRHQASAALERIVWPGKPGYVPPPPPKPLTSQQQLQYEAGAKVYAAVCTQCHKPDGRGQEGLAPPLVDSDWTLGSEQRIARIVLHGMRGPITVNGRTYNLDMPGWGALTDQQIADVLTYVRRSWQHDADPVAAETVAKIRARHEGRMEAWTERELLAIE